MRSLYSGEQQWPLDLLFGLQLGNMSTLLVLYPFCYFDIVLPFCGLGSFYTKRLNRNNIESNRHRNDACRIKIDFI